MKAAIPAAFILPAIDQVGAYRHLQVSAVLSFSAPFFIYE
jgi:hypothetical protein